MKPKDLLKKNLRSSKVQSRASIITVAGIESNVGCTHFSIMLAHYLCKERLKVAILECNRKQDFARIEKAYEGSDFDSTLTKSFKVRGITYYKETQPADLNIRYQESFDYIILDMGHDFKAYKDDIVRADFPYFIGYYNDWKGYKYERFVAEFDDLLTSRSKLLINMGDKEDVNTLSKYAGQMCFHIPFAKDPFVRSKAHLESFNKIMGVK